MIKRTLFSLLCLLAMLQASLSFAQSIVIDNTEYRQKVLKYLSSDYFITEGVGLKKVYIGQSQDQLVKELGKPAQVKKPGFLSSDRIYYYKLDNETTLQVAIVNKQVKAIAFAGKVSSQYTTVKGARFEMTPYEILNLYGQTETKDEGLVYNKLGVRFDFKGERLKVIRIFQPAK